MAAEKAAELLLGPVVNLTISKVTEQLDLAVGFKQELMSFQGTLEMVKDLLGDAEQKGVAGSSGVSSWLKRLRSIVEEADDVMDEISYENLRRKVAGKKQMLEQVRYLAFRFKMANKIKNLNAELDVLNARAIGLGLQVQHRLETSLEPRGIQPADSLLGEPSGVIGRDGDVSKIVQLLTDPNTQQPLCVISIVGLPGLGKTTLAKLVRSNGQIQAYFSNIMWICVSENFDVKSILVQMLESLNKGGYENITNLDVIVQKIEEKLEQKNYLLILDDVWNEQRPKWEDLRHRLVGISKKNGSRVLVTTRIQNVASVMGALPAHVYCLRQLTDEDCWFVIRHRVFGNSPIPSELKELETIGRENAKNCKGVPLVASVIGGILCNNLNKDVWCEVWGSIEEANGVMPVLQLSLSRLPEPALKQCFAFCSIFPKDSVMEKEILIQLWMAHGFLQSSRERRMEMEDIGDKYFNDLISYSLFQDAEKDSCGRVITCKMHDLIHDLAQSISEPQILILGNDSGSNIIADIRHLNLISDEGMVAVETGDAMQKLHTLLSKIDVFHNTPANFKKMRVLSFCGAKIDKLPVVLKKLKHLRYLDVSKTKIKELPQFITKLYQLQTLRFMDCDRIKRPLEGIGNLVNLRHIYFNDEKLMPAGVGTLTCLQTLELFVVGQQKGRQIEELGGLSQLKGKLEVTNLKIVRNREEAIIAKLSEKTTIQELALDFDRKVHDLGWIRFGLEDSEEYRSEERRKHDEDVLEGLQPHSNLKSLRISNYCGEKCPSWMLDDLGNLGESTHLKNLVSLNFYYFHQLKIIPSLSLSNLPKLKIQGFDKLESMPPLSLNSGAKVSIKRCKNLKSIADSHLQKLSIYSCEELISIEFGTLATMSLKEIQIRFCSKLKSLPMLTELPYLRRLSLYDCQKLRDIGDGLFASTCPNLEEFIIESCWKLMSMPSLDGLSSLQRISISGLHNIGGSLSTCTSLQTLSIDYCDNLESVSSPDGLGTLATMSLKEIQICYCSKLESLPRLTELPYLRTLRLVGCTQLGDIGDGLFASTCPNLEELIIEYCRNLMSMPSLDELSSLQRISIRYCGLKSIEGSLSTCTSLQSLSIVDCDNLESISSPNGLSSLEELTINGDNNPVSRPSVDQLKSLKIEIWDCSQLKSIGESLFSSMCLKNLSIFDCYSLESIPSLDGLSSLETLSIQCCERLTSLPSGLSSCTALETLIISNCGSLISISEDLRDLRSLVELEITRCGKLSNIQGLGEIHGCLTRLRKLRFGGFSAEQEELGKYPIQLKELSLIGWEKLENLPCQIQKLTALRTLGLHDFHGIEALPDWLGNLSSLQSLYITNCGSLRYMKAIRRLSNLKRFDIWDCPELRRRCAKESGEEWNNIRHIPHIDLCRHIGRQTPEGG